jgi:plasmid stabilization system protein ParE
MAGESRRVTWTAEALSALDEALSYIAQESPQGASLLAEQALKAADSLATLSQRGRVVPEQDEPTIREVFVGRYRLLYEVTESEVIVLTFLHGARDFARWRGEQ